MPVPEAAALEVPLPDATLWSLGRILIYIIAGVSASNLNYQNGPPSLWLLQTLILAAIGFAWKHVGPSMDNKIMDTVCCCGIALLAVIIGFTDLHVFFNYGETINGRFYFKYNDSFWFQLSMGADLIYHFGLAIWAGILVWIYQTHEWVSKGGNSLDSKVDDALRRLRKDRTNS